MDKRPGFVLPKAVMDGSDRVGEADMVNHPPHYTAYKGLEVIQLTEQMNFCRGNAVKYICRAGLKGDKNTELEDLRKAVWYVEREIQRLEAEVHDS